MSTIPLAVNTTPLNYGTSVGEAGPSLQALINQTKLQEQAIQAGPTQLELQKQKLQQEQIATQEAQQNQKDQLIFNQAFKDANGDWDQAVQGAIKGGVSGGFATKAQLARNDMLTKAAALTKDQLEIEAEKSDALAQSALKVTSAEPEDQASVYAEERNKHLLSGAFSPNDIPEQMPPIADLENLAHHNKATQDLIKQAQAIQDEQTQQPEKKAEAEVKQTQALGQMLANAQSDVQWQSTLKTAKMNGTPDSVISQFAPTYSPDEAARAKQMAISPEQQAQVPLEKQEAASWLAANPKKTLADYMRYKATLVPAFNFNLQGGAGGGLNSTALDQAAQRYAQTGVLPAMGMGTAGAAARKAIMNRAGEMFPQNSIASGSAEYAANEASLKNLQTNFDRVNAFENTALKNLDQVAKTGAKIPELGSRFADTPVRLINEKMVGTPEMAQFKTALLTAQTEAAKVLSSANATGVLSDSARHEAEDILSGNLPYPAMVASINQLKTDFANRHQAYQDQIADIKGRIGAAPGAPPAQKSTQSTGKTLSQAQIERAAKDHGISVEAATKQAQDQGYTIK